VISTPNKTGISDFRGFIKWNMRGKKMVYQREILIIFHISILFLNNANLKNSKYIDMWFE